MQAATMSTTPAMTTTPHMNAPASDKALERQAKMLGQLLVRRGLITPEQLTAALDKRGNRRLEDALVETGAISRTAVATALATAVGIPFVTLMPQMVRPEALACLPADFCIKNNVLPMALAEGWLTVALEDFANVFLTDEIKRLSGKTLQIVAALGENIRQTLAEAMKNLPAAAATGLLAAGADGGAMANVDDDELAELTILTAQKRDVEEEPRDLEAAASGSPIIRLVNRIIRAAVAAGASDIHIEPEEGEFRIRYRIDGELVPEALRPSVRLLSAVVSRIKIMAQMDISERRLPQDGGITIVVSEKPIELRVSTMPAPLGEKVVMRIVDNSTGVRKLDELGFLPDVLQGLRRAISNPNGIVLVTGPTGSGKSTTLYSALSELKSDKLNISSIEDPVEYHLRGINQFQVNTKAGFTFARALRSLLRQDPDIVMVGEIRDSETAKLATEAALTGHLVLSTLHTNDAPSAVPRIVNMGVEPYLVAASVRGVLAQRLVRRLCQHCKRESALTGAMKQMLASAYGGASPVESAFAPVGCAACRQTGYRGRTGIHEMLLTDEEMFEQSGAELSLSGIRRVARERGMFTMLHDCVEKVKAGVLGLDALYEVVGSAGTFDEQPTPRNRQAA
ncbi:MAG TPA: GspE/PulE family protein [Tepidisphaeraceae bacterium]|nr:GspE/PulE family protein [Tepidisphaeraceae bacterium]